MRNESIDHLNVVDTNGLLITVYVFAFIFVDNDVYTINYRYHDIVYVATVLYDNGIYRIVNKLARVAMIRTGEHTNTEDRYDDRFWKPGEPEYDLELYVDKDGVYYAADIVNVGDNKHINVDLIPADEIDEVLQNAVFYSNYTTPTFDEVDLDNLPF